MRRIVVLVFAGVGLGRLAAAKERKRGTRYLRAGRAPRGSRDVFNLTKPDAAGPSLARFP